LRTRVPVFRHLGLWPHDDPAATTKYNPERQPRTAEPPARAKQSSTFLGRSRFVEYAQASTCQLTGIAPRMLLPVVQKLWPLSLFVAHSEVFALAQNISPIGSLFDKITSTSASVSTLEPALGSLSHSGNAPALYDRQSVRCGRSPEQLSDPSWKGVVAALQALFGSAPRLEVGDTGP